MPPALGRLIDDDQQRHWRLSAEYCMEDCEGFHGVVVVEKHRAREVFFTPGVWEHPDDAFTCSLAIFDQVLAQKKGVVLVERVL